MNRALLVLTAAGLFGAGTWLGHHTAAGAGSADAAPPPPSSERAPANSGDTPRVAVRQLPASARDWKRLFEDLEPANAPEFLEVAQRVPDIHLRSFVLSRLLEIWANAAPEAAIAWANNAKDRSWLDLRGVFRAWAEQNPAAAAARMPRIARRLDGSGAARAIAEAWCTRDPAAAIAWARELKDSSVRSAGFATILRHLGETDPQQAVALALSLDRPANSTQQLRTVVMTQAATDPAAALLTINTLPPGVPRGPLFQGVVATLLQEDPKLAGEFALTMPTGQYQTDALRTVTVRLAAESPQAALDWITAKLPSGPVRSALYRNALLSFAASNPPAAVPYLDQVAGNNRLNVAMNLALHWVRLDPQAAAAWSAQLPADPHRALILGSLARTWADGDPSAALGFALRQTDAREQAETLQAVAASWPTAALSDARATLDQLPSDEVRKAFVTGLVQGSARRDHTTVARWVASLPAGALHDSAAAAYVFNAAYKDPPLAIQVASSITANPARQDALSTIARVWLHNDRAAATAWLATAVLPEATKQKLLAPGP